MPDIASGKYTMTDSFRIFRCGTEVFAPQYQHDYGQNLRKRSEDKRSASGARLTGRYNYFDTEWHPFYHGTDLHTMQSVSKTVTSIIFGVAITRGDFWGRFEHSCVEVFRCGEGEKCGRPEAAHDHRKSSDHDRGHEHGGAVLSPQLRRPGERCYSHGGRRRLGAIRD